MIRSCKSLFNTIMYFIEFKLKHVFRASVCRRSSVVELPQLTANKF